MATKPDKNEAAELSRQQLETPLGQWCSQLEKVAAMLLEQAG